MLLNVINSGTSIPENPFTWGSGIYWTQSAPPPFPTSSGRSTMYTFVRWKNTAVGGVKVLGTYAPDFAI